MADRTSSPLTSIASEPRDDSVHDSIIITTENGNLRYEELDPHDQLTDIEGPADPSLLIDGEATESIDWYFSFLSTYDTTTFDKREDLFARREEGLLIASKYLEREFGTYHDIDPVATHLSRTTKRKFITEMNLVFEGLLAKRIVFQGIPYPAYQPCARFTQLSNKIDEIRENIKVAGYTDVPRKPIWGKYPEDHSRYWNSNDYEILSICYRYDIIRFFGEILYFIDITTLKVKPYRKPFLKDEPPHSPALREPPASSTEVVTAGPPPEEEKDEPEILHVRAESPEKEVRLMSEKMSVYSGGIPKTSAAQAGLESIQKRQTSFFGSRPAVNTGMFGNPREMSAGIGLNSLFGKQKKSGNQNPSSFTTQERHHTRFRPPPHDDDPDSSDSDDEPPKQPRKERDAIPFSTPLFARGPDITPKGPHFDLKLKVETIPEWDGNSDTLATWILKVNSLSKRLDAVHEQLGQLVPTRLRKDAELWYYSLPEDYRSQAEENWGTLRDAIGTYFMNRAWLDKQKMRARVAHYREASHSQETPSAFYIRKSQLLWLVFNMSDTEIIMEVMNSAPSGWNSILTTHFYNTVVEFQAALKFHEDTLIKISHEDRRKETSFPPRSSGPSFSGGFKGGNSSTFSGNKPRARGYAVGSHPTMGKPLFPRDDSNMTKRQQTPTQAGARPCRHCGTGNHWDFECKHAAQGVKKARANLARFSEDYLQAAEEYEDLYLASNSTADTPLEEEPCDEEKDAVGNDSDQDF